MILQALSCSNKYLDRSFDHLFYYLSIITYKLYTIKAYFVLFLKKKNQLKCICQYLSNKTKTTKKIRYTHLKNTQNLKASRIEYLYTI